jgi:prolyl oligopeptidase
MGWMQRSPLQAARREVVVDELHGMRVPDPCRWLEAGEAPEVQAWVAAQRDYARALLDADPARAAIAARIEQAMACGVLGAVVPRGRFRFLTRRTAGMNQVALYVREGDQERCLLDPGVLRADSAVALDWYHPSHDGELVAVGLSESGDENSTLSVLETGRGRILADRIPRCLWAAIDFEPDNKAFLYTRLSDPATVPPGEEHYHRRVWRHVLGEDPYRDQNIFGDGRDKTDFPTVLSISADGHWTAMTLSQGATRAALFLRRPGGSFVSFFEGYDQEAFAWFAGNRLLALTNFGAPNWRLVEIDPEDPAPGRWQDLIPESEHVLVNVVATRDRLLVQHLVSACSRVSVHRADGAFERSLELPPFCTVTGMGADAEQAAAFLTAETFVRPAWALEVDPEAGTAVEVARLAPPDGFEPDRYPVRQVRYPSRDGTEVSMFLIGHAAGSGPAVLTGYGGFNISRTPVWMPGTIPFLEAGGLVALANLRGGGEYGEAWHRAGMLDNKQNVFDDFLGAAEWLIAQGFTTPAQLGILGRSNGGLLVGAAMTQRPELFGAVVCQVPLLDMVRYEQFKVAELWASEYGSAADPKAFRWLLAYSPYHRVADGTRYPPILITTGEEDARVDPMHARKMAARLQAANPEGVVLLRVEPRAGHGQGKPVAMLVPEEADIWSFLLRHLRSGG